MVSIASAKKHISTMNTERYRASYDVVRRGCDRMSDVFDMLYPRLIEL